MKELNNLSKALSPYLLQHANNPINWYEWGEEALQKAKTENKPLIISIGYAACHWCHVMAHESFEDERVAEYMNEHFICVKVDREERPDIDQLYMDAAHIVTGRGGWPLNAIALPDGRPFYASTYLPKEQWLRLLEQLNELHQNQFDRVVRAADSITKGIQTLPFEFSQFIADFSVESYKAFYEHHIQGVDFDRGGYQGAPKFMMPVGLEFFLQYYYHTNEEQALLAVTTSLDAMTHGGIYDQLGGGFYRYSTDDQWHVPHFEKMLYDNAQLVSLYSKAFQVTKNTEYKTVVEETLSFLKREMSDGYGAYYSSIDADSEHEEGKFYVWTEQEIAECIEPSYREAFFEYFQISESGNWEHGKNIFHRITDEDLFLSRHGWKRDEWAQQLQQLKSQLLAVRSKRVSPALDDKVLCSWNALMISAYVHAYKAFQEPNYLSSAIETATFIKKNLMKLDGSLFRVYRNGSISVSAFLDDYALYSQALIDVYEVTFDDHWLEIAQKLISYVWRNFSNESFDMFFYNSISENILIARKFEYLDNVIPASNSVLATTLHRLGSILHWQDYLNSSKKMLSRVLDDLVRFGPYHANWALLLGMKVSPQVELSVVGKEYLQMTNQIQLHYLPGIIWFGRETEKGTNAMNSFDEGSTLIYLCCNQTCELPTSDVSECIDKIRQL